MGHTVLQYHLEVTSLVNKLATVHVLDLINEGSEYTVAVIVLALASVENAPDLVPGPGQKRLSHMSHIVCSLKMQDVINQSFCEIEENSSFLCYMRMRHNQYPTFAICPLIFIVFFTLIELVFHSIFSSINHRFYR